jgi:hypothetical protein
MSTIHEAAAQGDVAAIVRLLAEGALVDSTNEPHTPTEMTLSLTVDDSIRERGR